MATYEYKCPICQKHEFMLHPMTESPVFECENCKVELIKVFSAPEVNFKGNGWGHQAR